MLKIYLTDLAAYNKGFLHGEWITLPCDNLDKVLSKILKSGEALSFMETGYFEKHEEYFITDFEWEEVELFDIDEYENIFSLNDKLSELISLSIQQSKIVKFLLDENLAKDITDAISKIDDVIIYENQTLSDVAYDLIQECYSLDTLPSIISSHIDYEGIARDLEIEGNHWIIDSDVYEYIA